MIDPFYDLEDGWESEKTGMANWPCILIQDISAYLTKHDVKTNEASLTRRLLSDYKEQKAYSYFSSQWLFEIKFHNISEESSYCYLKAQCRPSQRINDIPHDVWILINKAEGYIQSAYCTCFAGLGQSCNHVAAVLLKVDFCWQYGHVKMACTSRPCTWNQGGKSIIVAPKQILDLDLKKPTATKPAPVKKLNTVQKKLFIPHQPNKGMTFETFLNELSEISPRSVTLGERAPVRNPYYVQLDDEKKTKQTNLPKSLSDLALEHTNVNDLLASLHIFNDQECTAIEKETRGQADNPVWHYQRNGRLTASKFRDIYTRIETFKKDQSVDMKPLISRVLGYVKPPSSLPALKYGRRMESVAVEKYIEILKSNGHKKIEMIECGLFVDQDLPYIGASPDRLVKCCCCDLRVLEVKCPLSCCHTQPTDKTVECLIEVNNKLELKDNHKYMDQIQGQMALTGSSKSDFFVFSRHGYVLREIKFDKERWISMQKNLSEFFEKFLAPELITKTVLNSMASTNDKDISSKANLNHNNDKDQRKQVVPKRAPKQTVKGKKPLKRTKPVLMCIVCDKQILESNEMLDDKDQSIQCDKCRLWFHWVCVNINVDSDELVEDEWFCQTCKFIPRN